ncbi:cytochrome c biogenesis protein CcsA [Bacillaceae bacterium S4-13-58]
MNIAEMKWIYELIIIIYCLSITGYFIDFIQSNRKVNKIAFWLLSFVWILQTYSLLYNILSTSSFPITSLHDGLYFYAWILVTFSLLINRFFRVDFFVFFTNLLGFFIMAIQIFSRATAQLSDSTGFENEWLITHITLALLSYGIFTLSFIFSVMYLLQYHILKRKKWSKVFWRLGDLGKLDRYSFFLIIVGVPLLLIAILLGLIWGHVSGDPFYWYDSKTLGSILVSFVYIIYLFLRVVMGYQGKAIAFFNLCAFLFLLVNYFLFGALSNFHF